MRRHVVDAVMLPRQDDVQVLEDGDVARQPEVRVRPLVDLERKIRRVVLLDVLEGRCVVCVGKVVVVGRRTQRVPVSRCHDGKMGGGPGGVCVDVGV